MGIQLNFVLSDFEFSFVEECKVGRYLIKKSYIGMKGQHCRPGEQSRLL